MIQAKQELLAALATAAAQLLPELAAPGAFTPVFERPKQASHGDWAITAAMTLAKSHKLSHEQSHNQSHDQSHKRNPRELAAALVERLNAQPAVQRWVSALEIAGPGFINLRLSPAARQAVVAEVQIGRASCRERVCTLVGCACGTVRGTVCGPWPASSRR